MDPYFGMVFYFCTAIGVSFTCSVLEAALLSTPISFIQAKIDQGSKAAKRFLKLKNDKIDDAISAILTWNTIAHSVGVAGFTAEATEAFGDEYFGIISGGITFAILILSELIPKSIGAHYWKGMTGITANLVTWMIWISYPLVWLARWIMAIFTPKEKEATISREEVSSMVSIGKEENVFTERESDFIQSILALRKLSIRDIMTPRTVVKTFSLDTKLSDFPEDFEFSRIPVYEGEEGNIVGIAFKTDIYQDYDVNQPELRIRDTDYDREILFVPENSKVFPVFEKLRNKKHLAIVVDEYGTFVGVVSLEDIIETIFKIEICDETDKIEDMQEYAKKLWEEKKKETQILE